MMGMNNVEDEFSGISLFAEVGDPTTRAYNRYQVVSNLREAGLPNLAVDYISQLDVRDRLALAMMAEYIKRKGVEETARVIGMRNAA